MTTTTLAKRIHNFGAGPAALPLPVLERVQAELLDYAGTGMSVLEMSHRSAAFEGIIQKAEEDLRALAGLGSDHVVLFLQGGASLQFSMLPRQPARGLGLRGLRRHGSLGEGRREGGREVGARARRGHDRGDRLRPRAGGGELQLDPQAAYLHFTSNNTIYGTQWATAPEPPKGVPLVCDMSSDALSRPLDIAQYGLVYAGAQKNLGPAGVTLVVMRRELLERVPAGLPAVLDYKLMAENRSLYNTPPCFAIYVTGLVLAWLREQGGLAAAGERNAAKAALVYEAIDGSDGFYRGHRAAGQPLGDEHHLPAEGRGGREGLPRRRAGRGARRPQRPSLGRRVRASLYNACPRESGRGARQLHGRVPPPPRLTPA